MLDVILIEPENPGNIGAIARVMKNFGFTKLVIVNPQCNHLDTESLKRSKHAQDILKNAVITDKNVFNQYDYLIGTTAKLGTDYNIPRSPLTIREFSSVYITLDLNTKIALIIGREGIGLTNDEINKCDFMVTIPSSLDYPTLNISHAVAILLYELFIVAKKPTRKDTITPISNKEKQVLAEKLDLILEYLHFTTEDKKQTQRKVWNKIFAKSFVTKREAFVILGFFKKIIERFNKKS